ncbi:MAG TPA: radical SAM protein, partial [Sediminispirochaeta sp.]|nr:radical SAM protein [Sediminispirochaeta sp.]
MTRIIPERDLADILPLVQMPGRYTGGEFGARDDDAPSSKDGLRTAICFPDLYEIGMSNTAVKLLYQFLNQRDDVVCDRVFAPAPDFERLLIEKNIPLFSLESGTPLCELDMLGFSVGYELSATGILTVLDRGWISLKREDRGATEPIIIGGGPALSNPAPFADFFDAIYLGEMEESFGELVSALLELKKSGASRQEKLDRFTDFDALWIPGRKERASRVPWKGFSSPPTGKVPVQSISVVQDHGVIEIMRGCPNGCRFCHAGNYYRPVRQKTFSEIVREADEL